LGLLLAQLGSAKEGIEEIQQGIAAWHALGAAVALPDLLAEGQARAALDTTDEALSWTSKNGEHVYDSWVHSCRGDIFRALGKPDLARNQYQVASDVARQQGAKSWELYASVRLGRLWCDQGNHTAARNRLTPIYGWFTEGPSAFQKDLPASWKHRKCLQIRGSALPTFCKPLWRHGYYALPFRAIV
jgi:tetratricopeptide (TPR) repeat protein